MSFTYHLPLCWSTTDMSQLVASRGAPGPTCREMTKPTVAMWSRVAQRRETRGAVMPVSAGRRAGMGDLAHRPSPSVRGGVSAGPRSAEADGSSPYTGDSAPLSRLATLSLRTITPSADRPWQPGAGEPLPIPCSIVRHKPTTRAPLEPNKPHRYATEVASSHTRHGHGSATAMRHPADGNSLHSDTQ
jgi:hypothetical protein